MPKHTYSATSNDGEDEAKGGCLSRVNDKAFARQQIEKMLGNLLKPVRFREGYEIKPLSGDVSY